MKKDYSHPTFALLFLSFAFVACFSTSSVAQKPKSKPIESDVLKVNWREAGNKENVNFMQLKAKFDKEWENKKPAKGEGFKPFKRWEDYMTPRVYPSGDLSLPASTYSNFMDWQKANTALSANARMATAAAASTANWQEIGPLSKPAGYDAGVGRIDFVRFHPTNSDILYVCSPDGGLWKTTDGGANWTTNTDFLPIIGCADLVIDPTNPLIMYLATGNREFDRSSIGILKTVDGGTTWTPTGLVIPSSNLWTIRRLIMDPSNPQTMIAVLNVGVRRTTDGWATFDVPAELEDVDLQDVEFKPGDPNTVYTIGKSFYKSTDKGISWTEVSSNLPDPADAGRSLIAVTAANPDYIYALYGNTDGGYLGTYRSTNSGDDFTEQSTLTSLGNNIINCDTLTTVTGGQAGHNLAIVVSPTDADLVTIGGCNVWQSADGGVSWQLSSYWLGNDVNYPGEGVLSPDYVHADIQSLEYLPNSSSTLFVTCDGGISKSTNGGNKKWTDISNNLRVAQMTNVGQSSLNPYQMITGLQDIGTLKNSDGTWFVTNGGDGEDGFIDRTNDNVIITSNPNGAFALSLDAGVTREDITGLPPGTEFFSPIHQDPVDANVVYAGGRAQLYRSTTVLTDPDATWTALGTPPGTEGGIKRFEIAPSNNQVIYVIKDNSFSKSIAGGASFTDMTGTLPTGLAQLTNLTVSDTDPNKVWVTFSGYEATAKVYKTTDGGNTWINTSTGLPNIPMNTIVFTNGSIDEAIYVGADIGVYYMDNNTAWTQFSTDLPNNHVNDLEIYYPTQKIRAATYGRGLWESDLFTQAALPTVSISVSGNAGSEGDQTSITVTVTASAPVSGNQTVTLGVDGTDITTGDFILTAVTSNAALVATSSNKNARTSTHTANKTNTSEFQALAANAVADVTVTIPDGQTMGTATFTVVDDAAVETSETAVLTISNPTAGITLGSPITQNITIADNDANCNKPNAGENQSICLPKTTLKLKDAPAGTEWITAPSGNPAAATIDPTNGEITGMITAGIYTFILQNTGETTCNDEMTVTVTEGEQSTALCNDGSASYTLVAQANLNNVKWYSMDGTEVGTGNSLIVSSNTSGMEDGSEAYYFVGEDTSTGNCIVELCCPVKFISQNCCPTPNCLSVTIIKKLN